MPCDDLMLSDYICIFVMTPPLAPLAPLRPFSYTLTLLFSLFPPSNDTSSQQHDVQEFMRTLFEELGRQCDRDGAGLIRYANSKILQKSKNFLTSPTSYIYLSYFVAQDKWRLLLL